VLGCIFGIFTQYCFNDLSNLIAVTETREIISSLASLDNTSSYDITELHLLVRFVELSRIRILLR
jgi:hypothetical protein